MQQSDILGVGFWEFALVVALVLLVLGPEKIAPIARAMGKVLREMQRGAGEVRRALKIDEELDRVDEIKKNVVHDMNYGGDAAGAGPKDIASSGTKSPVRGSDPGEAGAASGRWDTLHDGGTDEQEPAPGNHEKSDD